MGYNTFPGYDTMVMVLGFFLYAAVPLGTAVLCYALKPKRLPLAPWQRLAFAPWISLCILFISRRAFLFIFSRAGMHKVFQWRLQLVISIFLCGLLALYDKRGELQARPAKIRWPLTIVAGYLCGFLSSLSIMRAGVYAFNFDFGNPTRYSPHGGIGLFLSLVCAPFFILLAFFVLYKIHPIGKIRYRLGRILVIAVSIAAGLISSLFDWSHALQWFLLK